MPVFPVQRPERLGHSAGKSGSSQITADWPGGYSRLAHCRIWTAGPGTRPLPDGKFGWTSRAVVWYDLAVRTGAFAGSLAGILPFPWGTEVAGSRQDAPPSLSPGERTLQRGFSCPFGAIHLLRRARWKRGARGTLSMGFPWTPPRRHKEGGPACPPSLETPSLGDGSREPPSHGQKAVPAPLLRKGGILVL